MNKSAIGYYEEYVTKVLAKKTELVGYIENATVLLNIYEDNRIWDIMLLLDTNQYENEFVPLNSQYFVIDDHDHEPPVFTRVKSYKWLREDFAKRLPVALWIFQNAILIQEREKLFSQIISEQQAVFDETIKEIITRKYLEMRAERHNLRYSAVRVEDVSNILLKANIAKLCFEVCLLAADKPYPFKLLLSNYTRDNLKEGEVLFALVQKFLQTIDPETTIILSDKLFSFVIEALKKTDMFPDDFLQRWWLHLD